MDMNWSYLHSPDFLSKSLHFMTCIEIPVHILGVYCILFQTPDSMKSVKRSMLNLHVWSVLLDLGISLMTTPFVLFPALAGYPLGVLKEFGVSTAVQIWLIVYLFASLGVAILGIFENRYFLLFAEITNSPWRHFRVPFFAANYILAFLFFIPPYLHIPEQGEAVREVLKLLPELPEPIRHGPIFVLSTDKTYSLWSVASFTVLACFECAYFSKSLKNHLRRQVTVSRRSIDLQRRFLTVMHIQIFTPLLILIVPLIYIGFSVTTGVYNQALNNVAFLIVALHGLSSTAIMLMIHKPYREFICNMFCVKERSSRTSPKMVSRMDMEVV